LAKTQRTMVQMSLPSRIYRCGCGHAEVEQMWMVTPSTGLGLTLILPHGGKCDRCTVSDMRP